MPAYFDHAATSPVRPESVAAMMPYLTDQFGNPSGAHTMARQARAAIEDARESIANALGADSSEVVFTSGGTEADNMALMGAYAAGAGAIMCSAIEHHAVLRCVEALDGSTIPVLPNGVIDLDAFEEMLDPGVAVVSVMLANNEVGTIQPLHKVKRIMEKKSPRAVLHTDAVQAMPWLDVAFHTQFADLISISAHKFGGPQGVGALMVRKGVRISPLSHGGGQERERRSGTQNVAGIVGMAAASEATLIDREATSIYVANLRDRLVDELLAAIPGSFETGDRSLKIAGNGHICIPGVESEALLILLDDAGIYGSAGASCSSGAMEPSHVLLAMGIDSKTSMSSLRLSLGRTTTDYEVELALKAIPDAVRMLRAS